MGYFNTITESCFKEGPNGETLFFSQGVFTRGRIVPDEETRRALFNFQKRVFQSLFFIFLPYVWFVSFLHLTLWTYAPLSILVFTYLIRLHYLVRNLKRSDTRLGFKETIRKNSKALPYWFFGMSITMSVLAILGLIWLILATSIPTSKIIIPAALLMAIISLTLVLTIYIYKVKREQDQANANTQ